MDYRDHADGPDGLIDVETTPNKIRKASFDHPDEADMERELAATERHVAMDKAFCGFVIHHYRGYRKWLKRQAAEQR